MRAAPRDKGDTTCFVGREGWQDAPRHRVHLHVVGGLAPVCARAPGTAGARRPGRRATRALTALFTTSHYDNGYFFEGDPDLTLVGGAAIAWPSDLLLDDGLLATIGTCAGALRDGCVWTCGAGVQFCRAPRPVPPQTGQLVMTSRDPVPRHCSHTAILLRSCASGGRRVSQSSLEPLPRHAEQMTESLTTPDPLHAAQVSSITPVLLEPWRAAVGRLTPSCQASNGLPPLSIYHTWTLGLRFADDRGSARHGLTSLSAG
jgi:hypothetical protein